MKLLKLTALSLTIASTASAQTVVLTEGKSGRPLVVNGGSTLTADGSPTDLDSAAIVEVFAKLCLPLPLGDAKEELSALGFEQETVVFAETKKHPEVKLDRWRASGLELVKFAGSKDALKGEPIAIVGRAYATTGPYGPFKASQPQCNLLVTLPDFEAAKAVAMAFEEEFGVPKKLVVKKTWLDGIWRDQGSEGDLAVSITAPKSSGPTQQLHATVFVR